MDSMKCEKCGMEFDSQEAMMEHMKEAHGGDMGGDMGDKGDDMGGDDNMEGGM